MPRCAKFFRQRWRFHFGASLTRRRVFAKSLLSGRRQERKGTNRIAVFENPNLQMDIASIHHLRHDQIQWCFSLTCDFIQPNVERTTQAIITATPLPNRGELARQLMGAGRWLKPGVDPIDDLIREALANRGEAVEDRFVVPGKAQEKVGINSDCCWL